MWSEPLTLACAVCFGAADGVLLTSARVGVLVMVAVTCAVLAAFAAFFVRLAKKGAAPFSPEEKGDSPLFEKGDSPLFEKGGSPLFTESES